MSFKLLYFFTLSFFISSIINCYEYQILLPSEKSFPISEANLNKIKAQYNFLNTEKKEFFDTKNLKDQKWKLQQAKKLGGKEITIKTEDGAYVSCLYFNRNSNKIIVMGGGFIIANGLISSLQIFDNVDILWVDYWGRENNKSENEELSKWYKNPPHKRYFSQRFLREYKDVKAAVSYIRNELSKKNSRTYEIIGHGTCYGCYVFAKAQAEHEEMGATLFDKIILDSCWYSVYSIAQKISKDPFIIWNSAKGGAPYIIKQALSSNIISEFLIWVTELALDIDFRMHSVINYLNKITIPILFISGSKDLYLNNREIKEIWDSTASNYKALLLAPYTHTTFILKGKEVYAALSKNFIYSKSKEEFFKYLKSLTSN